MEEGETIAVLYTSTQELFDAAEEEFLKAVTIADGKPEEEPLILCQSHQRRREEPDRIERIKQ